MVVSQLLAALSPWAPYLLLLLLFAAMYYELRGAISRSGTTTRRSSAGAAAFLGLVGLAGVGLILTGWSTFGALALIFVAAVIIIWVASSRRRS